VTQTRKTGRPQKAARGRKRPQKAAGGSQKAGGAAARRRAAVRAKRMRPQRLSLMARPARAIAIAIAIAKTVLPVNPTTSLKF